MAATTGAAMPGIAIVVDRRRAHTAAFRAAVLAEAARPGARVQKVARRHEICASLIYRWRRTIGAEPAPSGGEPRLYPVRIADLPHAIPGPRPAASSVAPVRAGSIEIELAGDVRGRVDETVSTVALRRVMAVLRR